MQCDNDKPPAEPPPSPTVKTMHFNSTSDAINFQDDKDWTKNIMEHIYDDNDIRPTIATLCMDTSAPLAYDDNLPKFQYTDKNGTYINADDAFRSCNDFDPLYNNDDIIAGEIAVGDDLIDKYNDDDPIINTLKNSGILGNTNQWYSKMDTIKEETLHDVKYEYKLNENGVFTRKGRI